MRHLISAYPDVALAEFEPCLEAALRAQELQVLQRLDHPDGHVFPALSAVLARHPAARTFTCFDVMPAHAATPTTVMHQYGATQGQWDAPLVRSLSQAVGGWAFGMLSDRAREEYALGVFYAGCCIEAELWQGGQESLSCGVLAPRLDEAQTLQRFSGLYAAIGGGQESDLRWTDGVAVRTWLVEGPVTPVHDLRLEPRSLRGGRLRRAVFGRVGVAQVEAVLAQAVAVPAGLRMLERATAVMQTPLVLLDGEIDDAWFTALAWQLNAPAAAVDLGAGEGGFTWCEVGVDRSVRAGVGQGAEALASVWGGVAEAMGEVGAVVRWPAW